MTYDHWKTTDDTPQDEPPLCSCGHEQGWHYQGTGSCAQCSCASYDPDNNQLGDDLEDLVLKYIRAF